MSLTEAVSLAVRKLIRPEDASTLAQPVSARGLLCNTGVMEAMDDDRRRELNKEASE